VHIEIEHQHGRVVTAYVATGIVDVAGLGDDLKTGLGVQQQLQPAAHDRVVIGEDDPNRRR